MKLSKAILLIACGTALVFLPRRSSRTPTQDKNSHSQKNNHSPKQSS